MASLPLRQSSRRRSSLEQESINSSSVQDLSASGSPSFVSEDSQTLIIDSPNHAQASNNQQTTPRASRPVQDDEDVKKCWICFADETEDTAESSEWRSPCPCALVAHEDCLLDWIADMESPSSRKRTLGPPQLLCPQCKSQIYLARPRDPIVESVRATERIAAKFVTPAAFTLAVSTVVGVCGWHGMHSMLVVFGPSDGARILEPVLWPTRFMSRVTPKDMLIHWFQHWRVHLGLPLITPMLLLSRTHLADSILPVLPIVFFATQGDPNEPLDFSHWPPSASMAVAVLPYLRSLYNTYYERVWAPREKRWLKEIQPRNGQPANTDGEAGDANEANNEAEEEEAEGIFEVRIDGNIWEDWGNDNAANEQQRPQQQGRDQAAEVEEVRDAIFNDAQEGERAPPLDAPPLADNAPAQAPNVPRQQQPRRQQQQQQPRPQPQPQQERRLSISTTGLAEKVLGALIFPAVASLSGDALRLILPSSWTINPQPWKRATGILQEKWGRSIVGGCLFVVLKDAVMLYVRWKMAQQHRRRKVLDYDRQKKRVVGR